jgi:hypothetical protein
MNMLLIIVDDRYNDKTSKKEYLIKWSGYGHKYNTWEPEDHINDRRTIRKYERKKKGEVIDFQDLPSHIYLTSLHEDYEEIRID